MQESGKAELTRREAERGSRSSRGGCLEEINAGDGEAAAGSSSTRTETGWWRRRQTVARGRGLIDS